MTQEELLVNSWYYWNDPNNGLTSKPVKFLELGLEPGTCDVTTNNGDVFTVLVTELSSMEDNDTMGLYKEDLGQMAFIPLYWFKNLSNIRISKTGFMLIEIVSPDPVDSSRKTKQDVLIDLRTVTHLTLSKPDVTKLIENGVLIKQPTPEKETIHIQYAGGTITYSPGTPELTENVYHVLSQLRLWVAGFLLQPECGEPVDGVSHELPSYLKAVVSQTVGNRVAVTSALHAREIHEYGVLLRIMLNKRAGLSGDNWLWDYGVVEYDGIYYLTLMAIDSATEVTVLELDLSKPASRDVWLGIVGGDSETDTQ